MLPERPVAEDIRAAFLADETAWVERLLPLAALAPEASARVASLAASWVNAENFTRYLNSLNMPGVSFHALRRGRQQGSYFTLSPDPKANLTALGIYMLAELNRTSKSGVFRRSSRSKLDIFFKVYGSSSIRGQLEQGTSPGRIIGSWESNVSNFRRARAPYLLY